MNSINYVIPNSLDNIFIPKQNYHFDFSLQIQDSIDLPLIDPLSLSIQVQQHYHIQQCMNPMNLNDQDFSEIKNLLRDIITQYSDNSSLIIHSIKHLIQLYPTCYILWAELANQYFLSGSIVVAISLSLTSSLLFPTTELILERAIHYADCIHRNDLICYFTCRLFNIQTSRGIHSAMRGLYTLLKLGIMEFPRRIVQELLNTGIEVDSSIELSCIRLFNIAYNCNSLIRINYYNLISYPPYWFYQIQQEEQYLLDECDFHQQMNSVLSCTIDQILENAEQHVSNKLSWKLYGNSALLMMRLYLHYLKLVKSRKV